MKFLLAFLTTLAFSGMAFAIAPAVTADPTNQTVAAGAAVSFTATATGADSMKWQESTDGGSTFADVIGATASPLSFTALATQNGYKYRAVFTNTDGSSNSAVATLTVNSGPAVTLNPVSQSKSAGATVTFTADATGNPTPTVQWELSSDNGATFTTLVGFTNKTLSFTASSGQNAFLFRAKFTNSISSATTNAAKLTVTTTGGGGDGGGGVDNTGGNSAGVLVYNMNFKHVAGFGIDFFKDGYVVVPATGGDGEVIFLGEEKGKRIFSRQSGVKFFFANTRNENYTVIAMAGSSGASLSVQAYGKADDKLKAKGPNYTLTVKSARTMHGLAQAAFDESKATTVPTDGSLGFVEFAETKLVLDQGETDDANERSLTATQKTASLVDAVKKRGYNELTLTSSSGGSGTGGDGSTGTPTTPTTTQ